MKKSVYCIVVFLVVSVFAENLFSSDCIGKNDHEAVRESLLREFGRLSLEKILERNPLYLSSIGANYDVDNNSYFIEESADNLRRGCGFLVLLRYARINEVEISIFPPFDYGNRILRSRIRKVKGKTLVRICFFPNEESLDYFAADYLPLPDLLLANNKSM